MTTIPEPKRFYTKWSVLYEAYCVYDSTRKNPEGNDYLIGGTDYEDYNEAKTFCDKLNDGNPELFKQYGLN